MAVTFNTTYTGNQLEEGTYTAPILGILPAEFTGTSVASAAVSVYITGTVATSGNTVQVSVNGAPPVTGIYEGYFNLNGAPVYVFQTGSAFGVGTPAAFAVSSTGGAVPLTLLQNLITGPIATCFLRGTHIATPDGETTVEQLRPGDLVATVQDGRTTFRPVTWVGNRGMDVARNGGDTDDYPVRIQAGAFRDNVPHRDLLVTSEHCIFVDGGLIPVRMLVNGSSIRIDTAIAAAADPMPLAIARAGLASHGLSLAHSHVRLNSAQLHNAARVRLGLADPPADPSRRRALLAAIGEALDAVQPEPVDFGALMGEQASAVRLMMTVAQIVKHVDAATPVRFLIAETESGYTLLTALWLARLLGIERQVEISPLFETAEALESGARVLAEALRSPHWCDYLRATGRMCLQFGYSDSGRYVGQLAASYLIERLRLKAADLLAKHGLAEVEVVLFDTGGESIGRGAHPGALADRLKYYSPTATRQAFAAAGIATREECAFQGGDGYLLFGTPALAAATIARIAEHAFAAVPAGQDPIYDEPDFAAGFFATIGSGMRELVEDPGYAALLGAFGPALLDPTGSRPSARQSDTGGPATIRHPRELRAIPNNAILQQLGWCANTLQGVGAAASQHREEFAPLMDSSPRFRRAMDFAAHALAHSDLDVLHAVVGLVDPGAWLDRVPHTVLPGRAAALMAVARSLDRLGLWQPVTAMARRIQLDRLALAEAWPDAPRMAAEEVLLHALRIAAIQRIWLLGTEIPEFSPRFSLTRQALEDRLLRLDVPACLELLSEIFPNAPNPAAARDYAEPAGRRNAMSYGRMHEEVFEPMRRLFGTVREIGAAISHAVGAFG